MKQANRVITKRNVYTEKSRFLDIDWLLFRYYVRLRLRSTIYKLLPKTFLYKRALRNHLKQKGREIYRIDLKNPKTFAEKLLWLKAYHRFDNAHMLVDKYAAKSIIAEKLGKKYVIPVLAVYNWVSEMDFNQLPDKCVIKPNNGSGSVFIYDRSKGEEYEYYIRKRLGIIMKFDGYDLLWEWQYGAIEKKIIVEPYIDYLDDPSIISDYKFYCFNGIPKFVQLDQNRHGVHKRSFVDLNWKEMDLRFWKTPIKPIPDKPRNFSEMVDMATQLSRDLVFARIDLYNIQGEIKFGEITLHPGSGHFPFQTYKDDLEIGAMLKLPV